MSGGGGRGWGGGGGRGWGGGGGGGRGGGAGGGGGGAGGARGGAGGGGGGGGRGGGAGGGGGRAVAAVVEVMSWRRMLDSQPVYPQTGQNAAQPLVCKLPIITVNTLLSITTVIFSITTITILIHDSETDLAPGLHKPEDAAQY